MKIVADIELKGTQNVCNQVSSFASRCPNTKLVLVGYSQGSKIFDNALCGGGDPNQGIGSTCSIANYSNIAAVIWMGNPRFRAGAPYNVGSCGAGGVSRIVACSSVYSENRHIVVRRTPRRPVLRQLQRRD